MNEPCDLLSVFDRFLAFERAQGLFSREVCGVRFWHLIRFTFYTGIILPHYVAMGEAHPDMKANPSGGAKRKKRWGRVRRLLERIRFDPSCAFRNRDVLVALTPRVTRLENGRRVRLATDFFLDVLHASHAVLESPMPGAGYTAHDGGGRVFRWTRIQRSLKAFQASAEFAALTGEIEDVAGRVSEEVAAAFGMDVDKAWVSRKIGFVVAMDRVAVPILRSWLKRLGVRCVAEVVHYSEKNLSLTRAAHDLGIPVVELQHGTVYPAHAAYNLPVADSPYSPDYLLGWGDWWLRQTRNFPSKRAIAVGYPYLEASRREFPWRASADGRVRVLFISQGTVGVELAEAAVRLSALLPKDRFSVAFKLHPNESKSWRSLYPGLVGANVDVVENARRNIYACFSESDVVVGAYSTAILEGLVWGLKVYVMSGLPGADTMRVFAGMDGFSFVGSVEELAQQVVATGPHTEAAGGNDLARRLFMEGDAAARVAAFIDNVVAEERLKR